MAEDVKCVWILWDWSVSYEEELLGVYTTLEAALEDATPLMGVQQVPINVLLDPADARRIPCEVLLQQRACN